MAVEKSPSVEQPISFLWILAGLVVPLVVYAVRAMPILLDAALPFDTQNIYLPLAQRLLEAPGELWRSGDFLKTAPGTYTYMALLGADPLRIKAANLGLALCTVIFLFDAARRLAGLLAASAAAWMLAISPVLIGLAVSPMVEPVFLFLTALWLWASVYVCRASGHWQVAVTVLAAALALALATLTRATYVYWMPLAMVVCTVAMCIPALAGVGPWRRILLVHLLALLCVGGYMAKNAVEFGKPSIAVGTGAALYLGNNPLVHGQGPSFFDLSIDAGVIAGPLGGHLSLQGDAELVTASRRILSDMPLSTLLDLYINKAASLLFFSKTHLGSDNYGERAWRIALLFFAALGWLWGCRNLVVWMLAGALFYQWLVHIPVLYVPRYSVNALDIPLTLLAAIGVGLGWQKARAVAAGWKAMGAALAVLAVCMALGAWHQRSSTPVLPVIDNVPHQLLLESSEHQLKFDGFEGDPLVGLAVSPDGNPAVEWGSADIRLDSATVIRLRIADMRGECWRVVIRYQGLGGQERERDIDIGRFVKGQDFTWGARRILSPGTGGRLRMEFDCSPGTAMQLSGFGLYEASLGRRYRPEASQSPVMW